MRNRTLSLDTPQKARSALLVSVVTGRLDLVEFVDSYKDVLRALIEGKTRSV